jgi:hypothetical protein
MAATSPEAETIIRQTAEINRLMDQSASRIERVQRQLDSTYAAQTRFTQAQTAITSALERGRISQERANELLDLARQKYQGAGAAAQAFHVANDNAARGTRNFGQVIGQAGFQVQDFFVQVQGGTSALTALSQQGSQFLGVFGAGGAIAGAVLAIGALVAGLVLGRTEADRFKEAMERNRDSFERATQAAERWRAGLREEAEQLQGLRSYYRSLNQERQAYELRQANAAANEVEQRRAALQRDILGRSTGISQGINSQIFETEQMAARNYGRGSAEYDAIANNETIQRLRDLRATIESFRETGDVSENAIAAFSARLREASEIGGPLGARLLQIAREMEGLGQRSRDVERDTREVNARLNALGAQAGQTAGQVATLADELARLQRQAREDIGQENAQAIERARGRAEALRRGIDAVRLYDAEVRRRDNADQYEQQQRSADERRLRESGLAAGEIRAEVERTQAARRAAAEERARLESENDAAYERARQAQTAARAGVAAARREERLDEKSLRERNQLLSSLDEEAAANIRLEESLRRIAEARRRNQLSEEEATRYSQMARDRRQQEIVRSLDKSNLDAEQIKRTTELTSDLGQVFRDTFQDAVRDGKRFADVLKNIEQRLLKLGDKYLLEPLLQQIAQLATSQLGGSGKGGAGGIGGLLGQFLGGGYTAQLGGDGIAKGAELIAKAAVAHTGGVIGESALPTRPVPAAVFLDAPRYHSGGFAGGMPFANDEVPAVLRRGELVLTKEQQRAASGGGVTVINQIKASDAESFRKSRGQISADLARAVARGGRNR